MSNFIVFNSDGKILRTGSCQPMDVSIQAKDGEFVIVGEANDSTQMVINGQVVDKPPTPPPPAPIPPTEAELLSAKRALMELSAWQVRKVLTQSGQRDKVEAYVASATQTIQDAWHYASSFKRNDDLLLGAAQSIGLNDSQLDDMFTLGMTL